MRNKAISLFGLALLMTWASAAEAKEAGAKGAGAATCAQYAHEYVGNPELVDAMYFQWAQGFMSALNTYGFKNGTARDLAAMPDETQIAFLRNYCDAHPLKFFENGVGELYQSLPKTRA